MAEEKTTYSFKIRRIEAKEVNSEQIKGQHIYKLYAEEATEGIPKMVITSGEQFFGFQAGAHIKVTVLNDQRALREFNEVTKTPSSDEDPMKKDLAERKAVKLLSKKIDK